MRGLKIGSALIAAGLLVACDNGTGPEPPASGATAIYLTDAPFPYDAVAQVNVHIVDVELSTSTDTTGSANWVRVAVPDGVYDLLSLQNGTSALLGSAVIPPADYRALRLRLDTDKSSIVLRDGRVLTSSSSGPGIDWQSSAGIPVLHAIIYDPLNVSQDGADIIMDFDVGMSFLPIAPDRFVFLPVIRAINQAAAGSLTGSVTAPIGPGGALVPVEFASAEIHLYDPQVWGPLGPRIATASTDASGSFNAMHLMPRGYKVLVEYVSDGVFWSGFSDPINVSTGQTANLATVVLSEATPEGTDSIPGPPLPPAPPPDTILTVR